MMRKQIIEAINDVDLSVCSRELLEWRKTGILCDGQVRRVAEFLDNDVRLAESVIVTALLELMARHEEE